MRNHPGDQQQGRHEGGMATTTVCHKLYQLPTQASLVNPNTDDLLTIGGIVEETIHGIIQGIIHGTVGVTHVIQIQAPEVKVERRTRRTVRNSKD